jgi:hypothetical protein
MHGINRLRVFKTNIYIAPIILVPELVKRIFYPDYPGSDDAFIHLQVVRNLTAGLGWGINAGEPVNISTSPLFTILVSLGTLLGFDSLKVGMMISSFSTVIALVLLYYLISTFSESPILRIGGLLLGSFNIWLWRWNGVAMESTLAYLFVMLICYLYYMNPPTKESGTFIIGLVSGLGILTRPELILLVVCLLIDFFVNKKEYWMKLSFKLILGTSAILIPWFLFCYIYFSSVLPTTYYAKTSGLHLINTPILRQLGSVIISSYGFTLLYLFYITFVTVSKQPNKNGLIILLRRHIFLFLFPIALFSFYYIRTDALESAGRYYLPALGLITPIFILLIDHYYRLVQDNHKYLTFSMTIFFQIIVALSLNYSIITPVLSGFTYNYLRVMKDTATFLAEKCDRNDTVLIAFDIGVVSYYGHNNFRIADALGLSSPSLAGLTLEEQIIITNPKYIVDSMGKEIDRMANHISNLNLKLVRSNSFKSNSVNDFESQYICKVYSLRND